MNPEDMLDEIQQFQMAHKAGKMLAVLLIGSGQTDYDADATARSAGRRYPTGSPAFEEFVRTVRDIFERSNSQNTRDQTK